MFFGRKKELEILNKLYNRKKFEFPVIYGRRRVGKTTLIKEFCKNKKAVFFVALETDWKINLEHFSTQVYSVFDIKKAENSFFPSWDKAFDYIFKVTKNERIILVIDEYPYLAKNYTEISSILQFYIDHKFKESQLFLILCGSSMSFMEHQVLGYKSPIYGRRTAQFKIKSFNFFDSLPFFRNFDKVDKANLYGITGGIPEYLNKIDNEISVEENITELFLTPSGYLFEEPMNLMKQELREPATYNGILKAIAEGASKLNEIATKNNNISSSKCSKYLSDLIALGIIKKEIPVTEKLSKKSIYTLDDQMFSFWYRFVFPNISAIVEGSSKNFYKYNVEPFFKYFMGKVFEEICKQYLWNSNNEEKLPFYFTDLGRWWGNDSLNKRETEIDILAYMGKKNAIFAECKWTNEKVDLKILEELIQKSKLFRYEKNYFYIFAKTGFTNGCIDKAKENNNIKLIIFDEILD